MMNIFVGIGLFFGVLMLIYLVRDLWRWYGPQTFSQDIPDTSWCRKGGPRGYVTTEPIEWWIGKKNSGWMFTVPAGCAFESSVPVWLNWVFSRDDPFFLKSAALHDMLLEEGYRNEFADSQWFEAAMSVHAPRFRTWIAYIFLRARHFAPWLTGRKVN
jgi:hypothetical protein